MLFLSFWSPNLLQLFTSSLEKILLPLFKGNSAGILTYPSSYLPFIWISPSFLKNIFVRYIIQDWFFSFSTWKMRCHLFLEGIRVLNTLSSFHLADADRLHWACLALEMVGEERQLVPACAWSIAFHLIDARWGWRLSCPWFRCHCLGIRIGAPSLSTGCPWAFFCALLAYLVYLRSFCCRLVLVLESKTRGETMLYRCN